MMTFVLVIISIPISVSISLFESYVLKGKYDSDYMIQSELIFILQNVHVITLRRKKAIVSFLILADNTSDISGIKQLLIDVHLAYEDIYRMPLKVYVFPKEGCFKCYCRALRDSSTKFSNNALYRFCHLSLHFVVASVYKIRCEEYEGYNNLLLNEENLF